MTKYIDAEQLIAEIEQLKGQLIRGACAAQIEMETNCKDEAYNEVLHLLDSLQQEQQDVDLDADIEMEWDSFKKHLAEYNGESEEVVWLNYNSFRELAQLFFNLRILSK